MEDANTELWEKVFKTNPEHTKGFKKAGGFSGTAIKPLYLIHKATQVWGSMGDAWGAETAEHVIQGNTVFIKARLWYPGKSGKAWVEHWGGDVLVKGEKNTPNDEAFKMAFTDAVGKCLVQLGFSADVHMGMFDDSKYLEERQREAKEESAASKIRKYKKFKEELAKTDNPAAFWVLNQDEVNDCRGFPEPELAMKDILLAAKDSIKRLIEASKDPAELWGQQEPLIIQIRNFPATAEAYKELVKAGADRKAQLQQEEAMKAGMPPGFNETPAFLRNGATNVQ